MTQSNIKSNTHYALISGKECPIRENKQAVIYNGRWRVIQIDDAGATYLEAPGEITHFEIMEYNQQKQKDEVST